MTKSHDVNVAYTRVNLKEHSTNLASNSYNIAGVMAIWK